MSKRKTTYIFIKEATEIHGNKYSYIETKYKNNNTKVIIICNICGYKFKQLPINHINAKQGCKKCAASQRGINRRKTKENFIKEANKKHCHKYNYYEFYGDYWHGNLNKFPPNKINKGVNEK